jgi:putative SOS response-associated peptidase YedK
VRLDKDGRRELAMLRPFPAQLMQAYSVSKRVNSPRNDDAKPAA